MKGDPVVRLQDVEYRFDGTPAIKDVSITIGEGEFVGLVGPNGSGKTTLLRLILGILDPDIGAVEVFGKSSDSLGRTDQVGYVPQRSRAKTDSMPMTVREVVTLGRFPATPFGRLGRLDHEQVDRALDLVGLAETPDKRIKKLSGGQKQRAFIARALASGAELLILDEPTAGIDIDAIKTLYELLGRLNAEGITILLVEHDLQRVSHHVDRVVCLNQSIAYDGSPGSVDQGKAREVAFLSDHLDLGTSIGAQ